MIYYMPDPLDLLTNQETTKQRNYELPSGGILITELLPDQRVRIVSVSSTDPMDYMNPNLAPGQVLEIKPLV